MIQQQTAFYNEWFFRVCYYFQKCFGMTCIEAEDIRAVGMAFFVYFFLNVPADRLVDGTIDDETVYLHLRDFCGQYFKETIGVDLLSDYDYDFLAELTAFYYNVYQKPIICN